MKQKLLLILALASLFVAGTALASTVTTTYNGLNTSKNVKLYKNGSFFDETSAGEMDLTVGGIDTIGYCIDLYHPISAGTTYDSELVAPPVTPLWCQIAWLLDEYDYSMDSFEAAATQLAIWKLVNLPDVIEADDPALEAAANALLGASTGQCPLTCTGDPDLKLETDYDTVAWELTVTATLTEDGFPVVGELLEATAPVGTFTGVGGASQVTDVNGQAVFVISLPPDTIAPSVTVTAEGGWLLKVVPLANVQELLAFVLDEGCTVEESTCVETVKEYGLGNAEGYNVYACGDYTGAQDILGRAAVAGMVDFVGFSVNSSNGSGNALIVGGDATLTSGTIYGDYFFGGSTNINSVTYFGAQLGVSPLDFAADCAMFDDLKDDLALVKDNGTANIFPWGAIDLVGSDPAINVFSITAADIANATSFNIDAPAGSKVLINVSGAVLDFSNFQFTLHNIERKDILFNAFEATSVTITGISFQGSLLAPMADVNFYSANFEGTLIANNITGNGQFHNFPFEGSFMWESNECEDFCPGDGYKTYTLGAAEGYNVFSCYNYFGGLDVLGKAAVANNAGFQYFSVGINAGGGDVLIVGNDLNMMNGTVYGNAIYGGTVSTDPTVDFQSGGALMSGYPIDFGAVCPELDTLSDDLGLIKQTAGAVVHPWGGIELNGMDPMQNIFMLDAAEINAATSFTINAPVGSKVLINLTGTNFTFSNFQFNLIGISREDVLFNAPDATNVTIEQISFQGSLLAPQAYVEFNNANFEGTLVAGDLFGNGEFHNFPFEGGFGDQFCIPKDEEPEPDPEPEPATCSVQYQLVDVWPGGFHALVNIHNDGMSINNWNLAFAFTGAEMVYNLWNGAWSQSGADLSVSGVAYNAVLGSNGDVSFGFIGGGEPLPPTGFMLNGQPCDVVSP